MELGIVPGMTITVLRRSLFTGPVELEVLGSRLSIRHSDAARIETDDRTEPLTPLTSPAYRRFSKHRGCLCALRAKCRRFKSRSKGLKDGSTVALVGTANSGKSMLFNALTGLRQKVGNYPGVTVDKYSGRLRSVATAR